VVRCGTTWWMKYGLRIQMFLVQMQKDPVYWGCHGGAPQASLQENLCGALQGQTLSSSCISASIRVTTPGHTLAGCSQSTTDHGNSARMKPSLALWGFLLWAARIHSGLLWGMGSSCPVFLPSLPTFVYPYPSHSICLLSKTSCALNSQKPHVCYKLTTLYWSKTFFCQSVLENEKLRTIWGRRMARSTLSIEVCTEHIHPESGRPIRDCFNKTGGKGLVWDGDGGMERGWVQLTLQQYYLCWLPLSLISMEYNDR
jgi:hypothetical protein